MDALLISPPHVPLYINTDYNFVEIGEIVGYLQQNSAFAIEVFDGTAPGSTWQDVLTVLSNAPRLLIIHCTLENMTEVGRLIRMSKELLPQTQIACYGRGAFHVSHLLQLMGVEWIVINQDWELALEFIMLSLDRDNRSTIPGVQTLISDKYYYHPPTQSLAGKWALPALHALPIDGYRKLPLDEGGTRGSGEDFEFAIGISRGCDATCGYCPIPNVMGPREIFRKNLEQTVQFLTSAFKEYKFSSVSLFGANFTRDEDYVLNFCRLIVQAPVPLNWKCVTSPSYLSGPLIERMAKGGCTRIAIGVESIRPSGINRFPGRITADELFELSSICNQNEVSLICFIMAGLPGQTRAELAYTLETVAASGSVPRPMIYYDFKQLSSVKSLDEVFWSNRKVVVETLTPRMMPLSELMQVANDWRDWLGSNR